LAALSWSVAAFALSEIFSNCVLRSPSAIESSYVSESGRSAHTESSVLSRDPSLFGWTPSAAEY
jgi:hypothetical protein